MHVFYTPDIQSHAELPEEEAAHAIRVLRLQTGDEVTLTDGKGNFYRAEISTATNKRCLVNILETIPQAPLWSGYLHIAMAPTKNMDRTEWFAEKATEIGFDELTFLNCRFSERKIIKTERIAKILVSAIKQSLKARLPRLNEMTDFNKFISQSFNGRKFIAHCYEGEKPLLKDIVRKGEDALVLIGPEGDFSEEEVKKALDAITRCVETKEGNLLELAVEAARVRATLGEISDACEKIVGRYKAVIRTISGVYSSESKNDSDFHRACELAEKFAKKEGRQPRIMVAKMGQDGHDRGAKVVATGYADCGFDVDMGPLFQTPAEAAREAVENDVHVVGVSSLAAGHKTLVPQIIEELKKLGREDIVVIAGGVIPAQDYDFLYKAGVAAIFGPGTPVAKAACQILEILLDEE